MRQLDYTLVPERPLDTPVHRKGWRPVKPRPRPYPKPAASIGATAVFLAKRRSHEDARPLVPAPAFRDVVVFQDNYFGRLLNVPVYRKGWRPIKPRPRPYPKPASSVGASAVFLAKRRSREDPRPLVPAPAFQDVVVFQDNYVGRPLNTPVYRKGCRPVKPRPRPYPKPVASVGAARRHSREDARPMIPAPADNYVGFPPVIAGYVPEYGDGMEIDATGPFFTHVVSNATSHPHGIATASDINVPFNGGLPGIQIMVGYVPEFSETVEVDQEGSSIPSENPGMTEAPYHTDFNGPPYAGPQVNVLAAHLGVGNPYNSIINNPVQVAFLHANPPYNPREPLFPTRPRNVDVPAPAYPVQPPAPKALNAPSVVTVEEHPGNREELFNELFGDDGEEEEQEVGVAPDPPWGGDLVGEHDGDGDEDEEEVEIII